MEELFSILAALAIILFIMAAIFAIWALVTTLQDQKKEAFKNFWAAIVCSILAVIFFLVAFYVVLPRLEEELEPSGFRASLTACSFLFVFSVWLS